MELRASSLHAGPKCGFWPEVEWDRLTVLDVVLPHPTTMRLADLDLDAWVILSPSPDEMLDFAESLDVIVVRAVLADFESAVGVE